MKKEFYLTVKCGKCKKTELFETDVMDKKHDGVFFKTKEIIGFGHKIVESFYCKDCDVQALTSIDMSIERNKQLLIKKEN